jgi:membrane-associated protease RseP (regulator of RpoE activity)
MRVQTSGEFGGLGLEVTMEKGLIKVVSPIDGTPAARAGLHSGDVITSLDQKQVHGLTLQEAVDKMRGAPRAPITLTIVREGVDHPIRVKLIRSVIHVVPVKYRAEGVVGYIQITSFNEKTTLDVQNAVKNLKKQIGSKLKGYVIDLRNDPGGLLDQSIGVADAFLDQGTIVITKGRQETERSNASPGDIADGNGRGSASSSIASNIAKLPSLPSNESIKSRSLRDVRNVLRSLYRGLIQLKRLLGVLGDSDLVSVLGVGAVPGELDWVSEPEVPVLGV